jgi:hypothetical protein
MYMVGPESFDQNIETDAVQKRIRPSMPFANPEVVDSRGGDHKNSDVPDHIFEVLRNMIAHEVIELDRIERPDLLAPVTEQKDYSYKTAEIYGAVNALRRFINILEGMDSEEQSASLDNLTTQPAE